MKNKISILICILIIIMTTATVFVGCSSSLTTDDGIRELQEACVKSLEADTYYTQCTIGNFCYSLNTWADDESTADIDERVAQFTIADATSILTTVYTYHYFGASLPKDIKTKNAVASDYKSYYFEPISAGSTTYTKQELTYDEYKNLDIIKPYTMESIVGTVSGINVDNVNVKSIVRTGRVVEYILVVTEKCNTVEKSVDLSTYSSNSKLGVSIRTTNGLISKISVVTLNSKGQIDENTTPEFVYFVSYVGPNLKINDMPHYDVCENK